MSKKPAEILKLEQKGEIAIGKDADLIVIETKGTQIIEPELLRQKQNFLLLRDRKSKAEWFIPSLAEKLYRKAFVKKAKNEV